MFFILKLSWDRKMSSKKYSYFLNMIKHFLKMGFKENLASF